MKPLFFSFLLLLAGTTCQSQNSFDLEGHRGCRGLMPENTIPAFIKAVDLGVNTIEMDVVISRDGKVVVSHEPYMLATTCLDSTGKPITKETEKNFKIFGMTAAEIKKFDCGSRIHPDFPGQQKMVVTKPLLSEVIAAVEQHVMEKGLTPVRYNIEIKSDEAGDGIYHPKPELFVDLLIAVIHQGGVGPRCVIQSFDFRPLRYLHAKYPTLTTAMLISNVKSLKGNLKTLGYTPQIYSPYYMLVNKKLVKKAHKAGMKLVPWTVNKKDDMVRMVSFGVDGLITDFPNLMPGR
jgi:glycerophosphoryl diester phosphodiesterase